jgi:uncharacterized protein YjbI with pentapeptide repeats
MKVVKPVKVPVLTRIVEVAQAPQLHVAALLGFPLGSPRAIYDEMTFWEAVRDGLGEDGVVDEGTAKGRAELLVAGSFHPPGGQPCTHGYARARLGDIDKRVAVLGDRYWQKGVPTAPEPFVVMPVDWGHAFGGPHHKPNPRGKGAEPIQRDGKQVHPLPNIEQYGALVRSPTEKPAPAGMRAFDLASTQRRARAGTYDERWLNEHYPGMPPDAAPTFFNLAPEDQWLGGSSFGGHESFLVENMHPSEPRIEGRLPGLGARCFVTQRRRDGEAFVDVPLRCDTVWIFPESMVGIVGFHGTLQVADDDAADIVHLVVACEELGQPRPAEHYRESLARRCDKDDAALASLSDSDLMPERDSGVAPNLDRGAMAAWLTGDQLMHANARRGLERKHAAARRTLEQKGLDPSILPPLEPPPAPPPTEDLDALAASLRDLKELAQGRAAEVKVQRARALERARQAYAARDLDFDAMVEAAEKQSAGPPRQSLSEKLERLAAGAAAARRRGQPIEPLERLLGGDGVKEQAAQMDRMQREAYRMSAHRRPPAAPADADASQRARVILQAAVDSAESMAGRDFTGCDLTGMDLAGIDLSGAFLEGCKLADCNLAGANLENAVLARSQLERTKLPGARLRGANLGMTVLRGAAFDGADMQSAILGGAELDGTRLSRADLSGAEWLGARIHAVDFSEARLLRCSFLEIDFGASKLDGCELEQVTFIECRFDGASFDGARLTKGTLVGCHGEGVSFRGAMAPQVTILTGSTFPGADFRDAKLERACVRTTSFPGACFDRAVLAGADLSECDLKSASFERAVLTKALLTRAELAGVSFAGANLMNASLTKARIAGTSFLGANLFQADLARAIGDDATRFDEAETGRVRVLPKAKVPVEGAS